MHLTWNELEQRLANALQQHGVLQPQEIAWASIWLEACGYPGLTLLAEAKTDAQRSLELTRDALGIDLQNVSCAYLAPAIVAEVAAHGRAFLRNVRHGLFLVPFSVREGLAIGCPVDPAFALGGDREKYPYDEKLEAARQNGFDLDPAKLAAITG